MFWRKKKIEAPQPEPQSYTPDFRLDFDSLVFQLREIGYDEQQIIGGTAIKFSKRNIGSRAQDASFELHKTSTPDVWKLYVHTKRTAHTKFALIAVFSVKKNRQ